MNRVETDAALCMPIISVCNIYQLKGCFKLHFADDELGIINQDGLEYVRMTEKWHKNSAVPTNNKAWRDK